MQNIVDKMIEVKPVCTKRERKDFLEFPLDLYKGNPNFVPPLYMDEKKIFRPDYVYADTCDSAFFNAYKDGKMAGRIQCIIQKDANRIYKQKRCRFTRYDAIDDLEVSRALFAAAEKWALEQGMDTVVGPLGYSDLEKEGLLIEGFDEPGTFENQYNADYYQRHVEALGYVKEVDWTGSKLLAPESEETYTEMKQLTEFVFRRYKLHFGESKNGKDFLKRYASGVFELIDKSYEGIYGTVPFTKGMQQLMLDNFGLVINPKYSAVILDQEDKVVCFGIGVPSLTKALALTRGHLTPGVLWRLLSSIRKPKVIDLCIIGVDPEYLNRGISAALSVAIMDMLRSGGIQWCDTNVNLEENWAIQNQWKRFKKVNHKRFRAYVKKLT